MAGIMKLPLPKFILADGIYAIPGVSLLFFLAWWFGDQFRDLLTTVPTDRQRYGDFSETRGSATQAIMRRSYTSEAVRR